MERRELTCIGCPLGCSLTVTVSGGGEPAVAGHTCRRGEAYGRSEVLDPRRTVTSTAAVAGGRLARVPVKTAGEIPKDRIWECMEIIRRLRVPAPVRLGDVLARDCAGTGVDLVAAKTVERAAAAK